MKKPKFKPIALAALMMGLFGGCENITVSDEYIDPAKDFVEVSLGTEAFCTSQNIFYFAKFDENAKILDAETTKYIKEHERRIIIEPTDEIKKLNLDGSFEIKKGIKFTLGKPYVSISEFFQCTTNVRAIPTQYYTSKVLEIK